MFIVYQLDYDSLENLSEEMKDTQDYYVFKSLPMHVNMKREIQNDFVDNLSRTISEGFTIDSKDTVDIIKEHLQLLSSTPLLPRVENVHFALEHNLYKKFIKVEAKDLNRAIDSLNMYVSNNAPKYNNETIQLAYNKMLANKPSNKGEKPNIELYTKEVREIMLGDVIYDSINNELYVLNNIGLAPIDIKYLEALGV